MKRSVKRVIQDDDCMSAQDCDYIPHSCASVTPCFQLANMCSDQSQLRLYQIWLWGNSGIQTPREQQFACVLEGGQTQLSQVHNDYMHRENSLPACNEWVTDDDAAINSSLASGLVKGRPLGQTLITGSAELTGEVTDGYPALDVKAGIIF